MVSGGGFDCDGVFSDAAAVAWTSVPGPVKLTTGTAVGLAEAVLVGGLDVALVVVG